MRALKICIVSTTSAQAKTGNRITAVRWAKVLRALGHRVRIEQQYGGSTYDVMIALHARRSQTSIRRFRRKYPDLPLILALTGTDIYGDLSWNRTAQGSLQLATRLVVLQPRAIERLPKNLQSKTVAIFQSAVAPKTFAHARDGAFDVCVISNLRAVKDPLRAALAARLLPNDSRIRVLHVGGALDESLARRARRESRLNGRYRWLGEVGHFQAQRTLQRSRLLVLSSKMEGGANVIGEAVVCGVPVLASRIEGSVGLLGREYSGYFEVGDTGGLARLLLRAERDSAFLRHLTRQCQQRARYFRPEREKAAWRRLLISAKRATRETDPGRARRQARPGISKSR